MRQRLGFRHTHEFVVVKPIRLTAKVTLWPGEDVDKKKFRRWHLRSLWKRSRIAIKGSDRADAMIAAFKEEVVEKSEAEEPVKKAAPKKKAPAKKKAATKKAATKAEGIDFSSVGGKDA